MPVPDADRTPNGLRAVQRAVTVLRVLADHPAGVSLAELTRITEIPMTTVHRLLAVLREADLARETAEGLHAVGPTSVVLSGAFVEGLDLRDQARPVMRRLVDATQETCHLGVLATGLIVYLDKIDSPNPVRMFSRVGGTNPALTTAMGRSILAYASDDTVAATVEAIERLSKQAVEKDALAALLAQVRKDGYSTDLEDNEVGICCVGAPIFDHERHVVAAISVSTPTSRFKRARLRTLGGLVRAHADDISRSLGWHPARAAG